MIVGECRISQVSGVLPPGNPSTANRLWVICSISPFTLCPALLGPSPVPGSAHATAQEGLEAGEATPSQRNPSGPKHRCRCPFLPSVSQAAPLNWH